jgi:hypothetical protein
MAVTISNLQNIIFPFMYLFSGYLALIVGFWNEKEEFMELRGTDVVILTFVIGSFELLSLVFYVGIPEKFTATLFTFYLGILAGITLIVGILIKAVRKAVSK